MQVSFLRHVPGVHPASHIYRYDLRVLRLNFGRYVCQSGVYFVFLRFFMINHIRRKTIVC